MNTVAPTASYQGVTLLTIRWIQPSIKATFSLTLVAPQGVTCLSNMSVQSRTLLENGMQEVSFMKTPIMSTYVSIICHDHWYHAAHIPMFN